MAKDEDEIHRLKGRLQSEGAGSITDLSNQAVKWLVMESQRFTRSAREFTEERPFISLLLAFQIGVAVGRWRARHAKH
jgi:hypothetical protein